MLQHPSFFENSWTKIVTHHRAQKTDVSVTKLSKNLLIILE